MGALAGVESIHQAELGPLVARAFALFPFPSLLPGLSYSFPSALLVHNAYGVSSYMIRTSILCSYKMSLLLLMMLLVMVETACRLPSQYADPSSSACLNKMPNATGTLRSQKFVRSPAGKKRPPTPFTRLRLIQRTRYYGRTSSTTATFINVNLFGNFITSMLY